MFTKLRDCFSYDAGHQWRSHRHAGDFSLIDLSSSWGKGGLTLHVGLLGFWLALHWWVPLDEWEAA